jgi:hypothetical protein
MRSSELFYCLVIRKPVRDAFESGVRMGRNGNGNGNPRPRFIIRTPMAIRFPVFILRVLLAVLLLTRLAVGQEHVSFATEDGGVIYADD